MSLKTKIVTVLLTIMFPSSQCFAGLPDFCRRVLSSMIEGKIEDDVATDATSRRKSTAGTPSFRVPEKLTFDDAKDILHQAIHESSSAKDLILLLDLMGNNRIANKILERTSPAKTFEATVGLLMPEVTTLAESQVADKALLGLSHLMPLYYKLRYSDALSPEIRKSFAEGRYRTLAYLFHSRRAQLVGVRVAHRLSEYDPGLSNLNKFQQALDAETKPPNFRGSPPAVVKAYVPALARAKSGELKAAVEYVKAWYRERVYEFEGTKPNEVDQRMRMEGEINELRNALEKLSEQTPEAKEAADFLKNIALPKSEAEARQIIANMKTDPTVNGLFSKEIPIWEKQLTSPDELLRADVGRRVTQAIWRLEYLAEHGKSRVPTSK